MQEAMRLRGIPKNHRRPRQHSDLLQVELQPLYARLAWLPGHMSDTCVRAHTPWYSFPRSACHGTRRVMHETAGVMIPHAVPTRSPTKAPTTKMPTKAPTKVPTKTPTTKAPTTKAPTTSYPTSSPTKTPTKAPSAPRRATCSSHGPLASQGVKTAFFGLRCRACQLRASAVLSDWPTSSTRRHTANALRSARTHSALSRLPRWAGAGLRLSRICASLSVSTLGSRIPSVLPLSLCEGSPTRVTRHAECLRC